MNGLFSISVLLMILFFACNNETQVPEPESPAYATRTGWDIEPSFENIDSLQILYFDNPYGDSLKYTRFFSFYNTSDTVLVNALKQQTHLVYQQRSNVDTCRSQGKIFLFKDEQPVKTLYFSGNCPACCVVYFIKDGNFYYMGFDENLRRLIAKSKELARK
jgi:hypothetical protein